MIEKKTEDRFRVKSDVVAGPFLKLTLSELPRVREQLDHRAISYWVDSTAISLDGKPHMVVINFGRAGDAARIQDAVDEADSTLDPT
jgi:hypothetical protein